MENSDIMKFKYMRPDESRNYKLTEKMLTNIKDFINVPNFELDYSTDILIYIDDEKIDYKQELISYVDYALFLFSKYKDETFHKKNRIVNYKITQNYSPIKPITFNEDRKVPTHEPAEHILGYLLTAICKSINEYLNPKKPKLTTQQRNNMQRNELLKQNGKPTDVANKIFGTTYDDILKMSYEEIINFLNLKYGYVEDNYFNKKGERNMKQLLLASSRGIEVHHVNEKNIANLSNAQVAEREDYSHQKAENLVYCNLIEHLLLHYKIFKSGRKNAYYGCKALIDRIDTLYDKYNKIKNSNIIQKEDLESTYKEVLNGQSFFYKLKDKIQYEIKLM